MVKMTVVFCDVKCGFNKDGMCTRTHINIIDLEYEGLSCKQHDW